MLKKIMLGGLFIALVGMLIAGALNRTAARSTDTHGNPRAQTPTARARGGRPGARQNGETATAVAAEWQTVTGRVVSVDASRLEVSLPGGRLIEVDGGMWELIRAQSFTVNTGDSVTLHGFDEEGAFQISQIDNHNTGQILSLRDASGHP